MLNLKTLLIVVISIFLLAAICAGDVIHLKDGRKVEGKVISKDDKVVKIETKFGTQEFSMDDVERIEEKQTPEEEYQERLKNTNLKDTDAVFVLIEWCKENKLEKYAKKHLRDIIGLDPNNKKAREMLGYVEHEGKWYTPRELEKMKADAERAEKEAAGLVEYKGEWMEKDDVENLKKGLVKYEDKWVTPEVKDRLEKGLVLYRGRWANKEDVEKMKQGLFKVGEEWVTQEEADRVHSDWENPWILASDTVKIKTNLNYDYAKSLLDEATRMYDRAKEKFKAEPNLDESLITLYVPSNLDGYKAIGDVIGAEKSSNYPVFYREDAPEDGMVSVTYSMGKTENDKNFTKGLVRHAVYEQYLSRLNEKGEIPMWFINGQAAKIERFWVKEYISWSLGSLRGLGGLVKLSDYFDNFTFTEREILEAGFICAFIDSKEAGDKVKEAFDEAIASLVAQKKISKEFGSLEKALIKSEKKLKAFEKKH
jgi:hypothetical protein